MFYTFASFSVCLNSAFLSWTEKNMNGKNFFLQYPRMRKLDLINFIKKIQREKKIRLIMYSPKNKDKSGWGREGGREGGSFCPQQQFGFISCKLVNVLCGICRIWIAPYLYPFLILARSVADWGTCVLFASWQILFYILLPATWPGNLRVFGGTWQLYCVYK